MKKTFTSYRFQASVLFFVWIIGMLFSAEFFMSISMIGLLLLAVFRQKEGKIGIREGFLINCRRAFTQPAWWAIAIPFLLVVLSAPYSTQDTGYLLERLRIKLPFIILPLAFVSIPSLPRRGYLNILYLFFILASITAIGVTVNYGMNFQMVNEMIGKGQPMPTPTNHIRYSLMIAYAIIIGFILTIEKHRFRFNWEKFLVPGMTSFLLIFIHILSVRSGLAIFYLTCTLLLIRYIILSKNFLVGLGLTVLVTAIPFTAYHTIPSLKTKIAYMYYDYLQNKEGKGRGYSDSERLLSLQLASELIRENPVFGVGAGDIRHVMHEKYEKEIPDIRNHEKKMPHNQFVSVFLGTGVLGGILFVVFCLLPLFWKKNHREPLFLSFVLIVLFSFLVENTIENALGVALTLFFLLLGMKYLEHEEGA